MAAAASTTRSLYNQSKYRKNIVNEVDAVAL